MAMQAAIRQQRLPSPNPLNIGANLAKIEYLNAMRRSMTVKTPAAFHIAGKSSGADAHNCAVRAWQVLIVKPV
jgi:hypothetical protein